MSWSQFSIQYFQAFIHCNHGAIVNKNVCLYLADHEKEFRTKLGEDEEF